MKRSILLAAVLAVFSVSAQAEGYYAKVKAEYRNGLNETADSSAYGLTLGKNINKYLDAEVYTRVKLNEDSNKNDTRVEGAVVGKLPVTQSLSVYTRGALGKKLTGTNESHYWTIEPGIKYAVTNDLSLKAGYRVRYGFDDENHDDTRMIRLGADYALDKTSSIGVSFDKSYGDSTYNAVAASYSIKF